MLLNFDPTLLDQMAEGIIVLNHQAVVLHHNTAGKRWLAACRESRQTLRRLIAEDLTGRTPFPVCANFLLENVPSRPEGATAWLLNNGQHAYALVVLTPLLQPKGIEHRTDLSAHHYVTLLGEQVRQQIAQFQVRAEATALPPALKNQLFQMDALLQEMADLAMLLQRQQVFASERIDLAQLLKSCLSRLALQEARAARHHLEADSVTQGSIYGDAHWLAYAFDILLSGLTRGMVPNSHLQISVRQVGDFVVVTGRDVYGNTARPAGTPPHGAAAAAPSHAVSRDPARTNSRMVMTQRILELHSGQLKLSFLPGPVVAETGLAAPIESFSVTLLTGLPRHERSRATCTQCPFSLQAQAYAQDIAELMALS